MTVERALIARALTRSASAALEPPPWERRSTNAYSRSRPIR
jgi:hypothetical protein